MSQSQPKPTPMPRGREKGQKSVRAKYFYFFNFLFYFIFYLFIFFVCLFIYLFIFFFFFYFFQHIKMSKAFTLEKSQKNPYCLWHVRLFILLFMAYAEPVYSIFRTPTLPYRAQPLLFATGKMSLNWGLDCSSICSMHALVVNCLPSFGRAIGWTVKYEWRKSVQVIMSFLENLILEFGIMTSHFTSSVPLRAFC